MNAPENTPAAYPINLAHEVLLKSDDAMCVDEVARAIIGKKPTKANIKPVAKLLKELADLGLIEMEPRAGGVPFYRLIVASESLPTKTYPPETLRAMIADLEAEKDGEPSFLAPEDYEMPPADPVLLASANRMLCDRLESKDAELLAQAKVVIDLRDRLDALTQQWEADTGRITADLRAALESRSQAINESDRLRAEHEDSTLLGVIADIRTAVGDTEGRVMLGDLAGHIEAMLGTLVSKTADLQIQVEEQESRNGSLVTDVSNTRNALAHAINESDRLRNELIIERQAREELLEQDGVDVKDAAVGYLIRVTKRKPRYVTQPERARDAALAAVRAGAGRAEVLAVVPVGVARRGAEWRGSNPMGKGD